MAALVVLPLPSLLPRGCSPAPSLAAPPGRVDETLLDVPILRPPAAPAFRSAPERPPAKTPAPPESVPPSAAPPRQQSAASAPSAPTARAAAPPGFPQRIEQQPPVGRPVAAIPVRLPAYGDDELPEPVPSAPPSAVMHEAWWDAAVMRPLGAQPRHMSVDVVGLVNRALIHSASIQAVRTSEAIKEQEIHRAVAEFDPTLFLQSKWRDINEPVGNTLTTGGPNRFRDHEQYNVAGVRKRNSLGGNVELSQRAGFRDTNSVFFVPSNQAATQLFFRYEQPLLRGAGLKYNRSLIAVADLNRDITHEQAAREIRDHILDLSRAYWQLYLQRATLLQQREHLARVEEILEELEARRDFDASQGQLLRAKASYARRRANLVRAETSIRNAESQIRALVNAPDLECPAGLELVSVQPPSTAVQPIELTQSLRLAAEHRAEVNESVKQLEAARVRLGMAKNELLPSLSLVLESYVNGLYGNYELGRSLGSQFAGGPPSYTAGVVFELPLGNRAAKARHRQRELETSQLAQQFRATMATLTAEVEVAVREVQATHTETETRRQATAATREEVRFLTNRWRNAPGDDISSALLLDDILQAQERLMDEEQGYLQALTNYNVALVEWKRATGTLLEVECVPAPASLPDAAPVAQQPDPRSPGASRNAQQPHTDAGRSR